MTKNFTIDQEEYESFLNDENSEPLDRPAQPIQKGIEEDILKNSINIFNALSVFMNISFIIMTLSIILSLFFFSKALFIWFFLNI